MSRPRPVFLLAPLLSLATPVVADDNYSCPDGVVSVGDTSYEVSERCGTPRAVETIAGGGAETTGEHWYYERAGRIPHVFRLREGRLETIERLKR